MVDWDEIDRRLRIASPFILTAEERRQVADVEQAAFERNLSRIRSILEEHETELPKRGFWTDLQAEPKGLRFRYSLPGFYGPGGFTSQFHVAGPLVLGTINPKADPLASFYPNELAENIFIGESFDEVALNKFVERNLLEYLAPENQVLSANDYAWVRTLLDAPKG